MRRYLDCRQPLAVKKAAPGALERELKRAGDASRQQTLCVVAKLAILEVKARS